MIRNSLFWTHQIQNDFIPTIDLFARCLQERIIPAFGNISQEADKMEKEEYDHLMRFGDPDYFDPSDAAERANQKGVEYFQCLTDMLQGIINLFTVGLYHLFEQQLLMFHRQELLSLNEKDNIQLLNHRVIKERLRDHDIRIEEFGSWPKIDELRLVANTVKHADGKSATDLRAQYPDLFSRPYHPLLIKLKIPPGPVYTPLSGDNIYITQDEFAKYVHAVKEFWKDMIIVLEAQ